MLKLVIMSNVCNSELSGGVWRGERVQLLRVENE